MNDTFNLIRSSLPQKGRAAERSIMPAQEDIDLLELKRITPQTELTPMEPLFLLYGTDCFFRGELVAVCGKAKSGKTLFLSILMAAALTRSVMALERFFTKPTDDTDNAGCLPLRVLWLDTEQSQQSTQDIMVNRIIPLAKGEQTDSTERTALFDEHFFAYNLRGLGFEKRRELMEVAIATVKPDLVIIDGIKDLVTDINDAIQATLIMEQLMALAQRYNCCIVNVLHQNKSEADQNMRGSIGTELTNKAFEVYNCEYMEKRDVFKVSQRLSRRNRIRRQLYYELHDDGLPQECDDVEDQPRDNQGRWVSRKVPQEADVDLQRLFSTAMEGRTQRRYNELMAVAMKKCGIPDAPTYYAYVNEAEGQGIIRKEVHPQTGDTWVELVNNSLPF